MPDTRQSLPDRHLPGEEGAMHPRPSHEDPRYRGSGKLEGKVAIITGADSGIGKAVAIAFAKEGARCVLSYLDEHEDARDAGEQVRRHGGDCLLVPGDLRSRAHCERVVEQTLERFGAIDVLVNHAGEQYQTDTLEDVDDDALRHVFETNVYSMFYLSRAALRHMKPGAAIVNTVSVVAYKGQALLLDYSASKGANLAFTRALAASLADKGIRVNGVAPGPVWTPLIPATLRGAKLENFGKDVPLGRAGQPHELAPAYVYLASDVDSAWVTGQVLHVNGGIPVNG
ncbi:MAG: SDR family oxidoreductase [Betaproteobacteria bacterium]|nr:SDR family oxidoreductase [Betaproteobacteria bacterium]MDE2477548.1 SDR family oxidoreductase [Betaproteobacteria bacterium]